MPQFVLRLTCENMPGIVAAVSSRIARGGGDIREAAQFDDQDTDAFFMRVLFEYEAPVADLKHAFEADLAGFDAQWSIEPADRRKKVLILVSKFDHCLADLLYRMRMDELPMDCVGIVCNHPASVLEKTMTDGLDIHHIPVTRETKPQQEEKLLSLIEETGAELIVLARYMQVLSDELSSRLEGRCINIHHSFLPGFKGAKPYHQAHDRGVKMIGATAHYVTADLDEGPIIAQDVEQITHADRADDLVRKGRDIERRVLAAAVRSHLEDRVLINGQKTVVFR